MMALGVPARIRERTPRPADASAAAPAAAPDDLAAAESRDPHEDAIGR
jgi:hypothetical protein